MSRKRHRLKRLCRILVVLSVLLFCLAAAGEFWIVPAVVRSFVRANLPDYWSGGVEIEEIQFSYTGPTYIRRIDLRDAAGRLWGRAGVVKLTLRDWPGVHPVLEKIEIEQLELRAHFIDGKCKPPFRQPPEEPSRLKEYVDLQAVCIREGSLMLIRHEGVDAAHGTRLLNNLSLNILPAGDRLEIDNLTASFCEGRMEGSLRAGGLGGRQIRYAGKVDLRKISMPALLEAFPAKSSISKGSLTADFRFAGRGKNLEGLRARGNIFVDDAVLEGLPVISHLFVYVLTGRADPGRVCDAVALLRIKGPLVTIEDARIVHPLSAFDFERGGTINLKTGRLDMYVVAVGFDQLQELLGILRIPMPATLRVLTGLTQRVFEKLIRLHIKGHWSEPPEKLIRKEPLKDIQEGTVEFLRDALTGRGQFSQDVLKRFGRLFEAMKGNGAP